MGVGYARQRLISRINDAFEVRNVEGTAQRVAHLGTDADAFDIVDTLGLFEFPEGLDVSQYRDNLPVPELNKQVMKLAFQTSVQTRTPLVFGIVSGDCEQVSVTVSDKHIYLVLTRKE